MKGLNMKNKEELSENMRFTLHSPKTWIGIKEWEYGWWFEWDKVTYKNKVEDVLLFQLEENL